MIRKLFPQKQNSRYKGFRYRGHEVKRIETFSDAVFAFAVTLLIVSLEVPKSFDELMITMRGFFAFAICFTLLMLIWHEQHIFFRRYGLEDTLTIVLNSLLMFIVLFYVYPLKFLFTLIFSDNIYGAGKSPFTIKVAQLPSLMIIYGVGYIIIYFIFFLLYAHALGKKEDLKLTGIEVFDTKTKLYSQLILISIGMLSIATALILPPESSWLAGMVYMLIGLAFFIYHTIRGKVRKKLYQMHQVTDNSN